MASVKYLIKGSSDLSSIYVRLVDGRNTDITVSTGYTINPKYWNKKGYTKSIAGFTDKLNIDNSLEHLKRKISDSLNFDKGTDVLINKNWLELVISKYKNPILEDNVESLIKRIEAYQESLKLKHNHKTNKPISKGTIRNFNTTISRVKKFEEHTNRGYNVHDVDLTFFDNYTKYMKNTLMLSQNSIGKDITQIKTVCIDSQERGFSINKQVLSKKFYAPPEATTFVTLAPIELNKIKDFKGADYLQNARDWLIIGCWTACRVGDLMQLNEKNIFINTKGQKFIQYTQDKTGKTIRVPMHEDVIEITNRLRGFPRSISDQRFNEWIKEVCKKSGIIEEVEGTRQNPKTHRKEVGIFEKWQLVRSHTCRRSFATNYYSKLSNKAIMSCTGHSTEKMLLNYIGVVEETHFDDFEELWNNEKELTTKVANLNNENA
jgi:integrase|tara:strand:+ start:231 stop:1529 length:1299 start_codon:yes stop_codon:yes gene_type:complete